MILEKLRSKKWLSVIFFCLGILFVVGLYIFSSTVNEINHAQATEGKIIIITPDAAPAGTTNKDDESVLLEPAQRDIMLAYMRKVNPKIPTKVANRLADGILDNYHEYNLPIDVQLGLITNESRFKQYARGKSGDLGFMQVVTKIHHKRIAAMFKKRVIHSKNIFDPYTNARVGGAILRDCLRMKNGNMEEALLCYNGSTDDEEKVYSNKVFKFTKQVPMMTAML